MPSDRAQTPEQRARTGSRAPLLTSPRETLKKAVQGARDGLAVVREAPLELPASGHLRRVGYGAALPLAILRALLRDPVERRRYLLLSSLRALFVLGVTIGLVLLADDVTDASAIEIGNTVIIRTKLFTFLSSVYGTLCAVEWCTIALTHEHDDQTARRASLLLGVPPEEPERRARILQGERREKYPCDGLNRAESADGPRVRHLPAAPPLFTRPRGRR